MSDTCKECGAPMVQRVHDQRTWGGGHHHNDPHEVDGPACLRRQRDELKTCLLLLLADVEGSPMARQFFDARAVERAKRAAGVER